MKQKEILPMIIDLHNCILQLRVNIKSLEKKIEELECQKIR
jgi:hypothetical protein